jgi:hypothetical protein
MHSDITIILLSGLKAHKLFGEDDALKTVAEHAHGPAAKLPDFQRGYVEAAFFTADPNPGPGEFDLDEADWQALTPQSRALMIISSQRFAEANSELIERALQEQDNYDMAQAGRDLYYSRNGHGTGYFARGNDKLWDDLQETAVKASPQELHFFCRSAGVCQGEGNCEDCNRRRGEFELM